MVSGLVVWTFGLYIDPIREETGWGTAAVAAGFSIRALEQGVFGPFTGAFVDRYGPTAMARIGLVLLALGLVLLSQARTLPMYYAASLVLAVGQSSGTFIPYATLVVRWFQRMRGRAMGLTNAGNGAGFAMAPLVAFMIASLGWRDTLLVSALLVMLIPLPLTFVMRGDPSTVGLEPDGDPPSPDREAGTPWTMGGETLRAALHAPAFYLLALAQAANIATVQGWVVFQFPHLREQGLGVGYATAAGVGYAISQVFFRPASGVIGDRIGRRRMLIAAFALQGVGIVVLAFVSSDRIWLLVPYYMTFASGQAAWVVMHTSIIADYFGPRRFATINALVNAAAMPVAVLSPVITGVVFDRTGSYIPAFLVFGVLSGFASIAIMLIRRPIWVPDAPAPGAGPTVEVQPPPTDPGPSE
ncbi:MAG: MFS transporter [Chloroflexi bacterium]|nr:MFS transporter [Chloroflexota bacterium]